MTQIVWRRFAFEQLDRIIKGHLNWSPAIGSALKAFAEKISRDPTRTGESRVGPYRIEFETPLTFYFRPAPGENRVYVVEVYFHGRE